MARASNALGAAKGVLSSQFAGSSPVSARPPPPGHILEAEGKLYAHGTATFRLFRQ